MATTLRLFFLELLLLALATGDIENRCSPANCQLPTCRCPGEAIPGGFRPEEIPQMVVITFDDAVNWENWDYYARLFPADGSRRNPNGCPIAMTLFVSHNFTDYCMIKKLHARGMEIADHSVTHRLPHEWWAEASKEDLGDEILSQRSNLASLGEIPIQDIKGWRSPFLQPTGDTMYTILSQNNFTYDATMTHPFPRNVYSPVMWPFTMDYGYTIVCNISPCPTKTYPGFWVFPVVVMMDYREHLPCAYVDFCKNVPRNEDESFQLLWKNFLRNYRTNRAPLYVNLHSIYLDTEHHLNAMDNFIQRLTSMDDVYIVTVSQAIEWVRNPVPLSEIKDFKPWQCDFTANQEDKAFCSFTYRPTITKKPTSPPPGESTSVRSGNDVIDRKGGDDTDNNRDGEDYDDGDDEDNTVEEDKHGRRVGVIKHHHKEHRPWFLKSGASSLPLASLFHQVAALLLLAWLRACV